MNWQPIETAPKDGTEIVLWCENSEEILSPVVWRGGDIQEWRAWHLDDFDVMAWRALESYQKPSHWFQITPPSKEAENEEVEG